MSEHHVLVAMEVLAKSGDLLLVCTCGLAIRQVVEDDFTPFDAHQALARRAARRAR